MELLIFLLIAAVGGAWYWNWQLDKRAREKANQSESSAPANPPIDTSKVDMPYTPPQSSAKVELEPVVVVAPSQPEIKPAKPLTPKVKKVPSKKQPAASKAVANPKAKKAKK